MNREEMLKEMGLNEEEFKDLVKKITDLRHSLNPAQRAAFDKALPTAHSLAQALSDNCSPSDVEKHLADAATPKGVMSVVWARSNT